MLRDKILFYHNVNKVVCWVEGGNGQNVCGKGVVRVRSGAKPLAGNTWESERGRNEIRKTDKNKDKKKEARRKGNTLKRRIRKRGGKRRRKEEEKKLAERGS